MDEVSFLDGLISYFNRFFDKKDKYKVTIKTPSGKYTYFVKAGDKEYEALSQKYTNAAKKGWETRRATAEKAKQTAISQGKSTAEAEREAINAKQRANYEKRKETKRIIEKHLGQNAYSSGKGREAAGGSAEQRWGRESQGTTIRSTKGGTRNANLEKMMLVGNLITEKLKDGRLSAESKAELKKELSHIGQAVGGQAGYVFGRTRTGELAEKRHSWEAELSQEKKGEVSQRVQKHRAEKKAETERAGIKEAFKQGEQKREQAETIKSNINKSAISEMPKEKALNKSFIKLNTKGGLANLDKTKNSGDEKAYDAMVKRMGEALNKGYTQEYKKAGINVNYSSADVAEVAKKIATKHPQITNHLNSDLKNIVENKSKGGGNGGKRIIYRGKGGRFVSKGQGKMERYGDALTKLVKFLQGEIR